MKYENDIKNTKKKRDRHNLRKYILIYNGTRFVTESDISFQGSVSITLSSLVNPGFNGSPVNII